MTENEIGTLILNAAIEVHRELGPGLLESVYEAVLARELSLRGLAVERQVLVPIIYKNLHFDEGFRADLIVEGRVLLELKSVERVCPAHKKQVQTYLLAEVEIVGTFKLANINRKKLEALIHKFFGEARLDVELKDRFGSQVEPREWFLAPLPVIEEGFIKS